ncbi:MAG: dCTP deaminase domain-containing protein [Tannerellaceae bacterium]
MILDSNAIKDLINSQNLLINHSLSNIKNNSYKIRIGKLIKPGNGKVIPLCEFTPYTLEPTDIILFISAEKIKLPYNITASYSGLYSISAQGILLINASMIESNYEGYLSGILVNLSACPILISEKMDIAKITFFSVNSPNNENSTQQNISENNYLINVQQNAIKYHESFLNINNLEKK